VALLALVSTPAWSANVVDVRVGKHPTFTRVVFELDSPTGYKLERHEVAPGIAEVVVSLKARAESTRIALPNSLIEGVSIEYDGRRAVARIRLVRPGLRLKEMILAQPPRVVLDVLAPANASAAAPTAASKPAPVKRKPIVISKPVRKAAAPAAMPASPSNFAQAPPARSASRKPTELDSAAPSDPTAPAPVDSVPVVAVPTPRPDPVKVAMATPERSAATRAAPSTQLPGAPAPAESDGGFFTLRNGALAFAGVGLLLGGAFVVGRRRTGSVELDDEFDEEYDNEDPFAALESASTIPSPVVGNDALAGNDAHGGGHTVAVEAAPVESEGQTDLFAGLAAPDPPSQTGATGATSPPDASDPTLAASGQESDSIFDVSDGSTSSDPQEDNAMTMDTSSFDTDPNASTIVSAPPASPGFDGEAVMRLVRELESRVVNLETRLEESVDARERLERQVAAQTEELRVQRAAIARTQRAVRNMSQPSEEAPTEPALRDQEA
jgi:hypothetical protein